MNRDCELQTAKRETAEPQHLAGSCLCPVCEADGHLLKVAMTSIDQKLELFLDEAERSGDLRRQASRLRAALENAPPPLSRHKRVAGYHLFWMIPAVASAVILLIAFAALRPARQVPGDGRTILPPATEATGNETRSGGVTLSIPGTELKGKGTRPVVPVKKDIATLASGSDQDPINTLSFGPLEMSRHFERAQNLLRTVRNANSDDDPAVELVYEKNNARKLLGPNRVFRQFAELNGDQQVAEILDSLENLLVDVANLSDHPGADEIHGLQDRIRRTEMVATLSLLGNSMASRGAIAE